MSRSSLNYVGAFSVVALLSSCATGGFDPDLRGWIPGALSTSQAAATAAPRPAPDSRGIISFPNYQVVVAQAGETPAAIAARLGLNGAELARHNALPATASLNQGAVLVLPQRVAGGAAATAPGAPSGSGQVVDPFAGQGLAQPDVPGLDRKSSAAPAPAAPQQTAQPKQHQVVAGETAWSISRKYGVSIQDLAQWNGLPENMSVRTGQRLMIPVAGQSAPKSANATTQPGSGSPTPQPPSASQPLPGEKTLPVATPTPKSNAPDLGATRTAASASRFSMPVDGSITRAYEQGKNDGIDIAASNGEAVKAADSGQVAAITRDTKGSPIVVVRHDGGLMTVYTGLGGLDVAKGDRVGKGQQLGRAGDSGRVHFQVRRGFDSVNPEDYLR